MFGGISTHLVGGEIDFITQLGFIASLRGTDSTGLAIKKKKNKPFIIKEACNSVTLLDDGDVQKAMRHGNTRAIIGHTRSATTGSICRENAHPFEKGHIIGAHNGVVSAFNGDTNKDNTDSENLYEAIASEGLLPALIKARYGAFALSFFDMENNTLNFIRNDKRPLAFLFTKGKGTLYWASERSALQYARYRTNNHDWYEEPYVLEPMTLITVDLKGSLNIRETKVVLPEVKTYSYSTYEDGKWKHHKGSGEAVVTDTLKSRQEVSALTKVAQEIKASLPERELARMSSHSSVPLLPKAVTPPPKASVKEVKPVPRRDTPPQRMIATESDLYRGHANLWFGVDYIKPRLLKGCQMCAARPSLEDKAYWFTRDEFLCEDCYSTPQLMHMISGHASFYDSAFIKNDKETRH